MGKAEGRADTGTGHSPAWLTRREALSVGAAAFGLSLPALLRAQSAAPPGTKTQSRARSVIILYLNGGPSQLDMWDLKPEAPREIRGTFRPIRTNVPGTHISEHMPRMARLADRYTIVRSMSHDESEHLRAGYWVMTGGRLLRPITAFSGMQRGDRPHMGAIVSQSKPLENMPPFVVVPEFVSPRGIPRPGQHAGFLGPRFDPYAIESDPNLPQYTAGPIRSPVHTAGDRLRGRRSLLGSLEAASRLPSTGPLRDYEAFRDRAFDLVSSSAAQRAFDVSHESEKTRQRYGRHAFGQSALVARRLVEAGVRVVQVNFMRHDNGKGGQGYDSHSVPPNPPHLDWAKKELLPPTDSAFAALIEDLDDRGLLDETLVVMMGEFGRTPRFNKDGGRDHWPGCYSLVVAGGGIVRGAVYGASDRIAARPTRDPVSPNDLLATVYHLLGIDHHRVMVDREGRPHVVVEGEPVLDLLA
ncbi:MAG: DUF1501 domain-containing protein [Planctomycetota bacterium]|nr:DUF1501 domain-containing protein [Planctomycetota bacterium]